MECDPPASLTRFPHPLPSSSLFLKDMISSSLLRLILCAIFTTLIAPSDAAAPAAEDSTYVLRANDVIRLEVYGEPDLSGAVRILKTGQASFPLIGSLKVSDLSVTAAAAEIRRKYAADYLVDPKLTLTVQEYATDYISVIGAVTTPGQIPIPVSGNLDLATAMATAGGLAPNADTQSILLVRNSGTNSTFSMNSIVSGTDGRTKLSSGDRIIVNQSAFVGKAVTILGQVGRQGPLAFPVNGHLDLVTAIAAAGGLTELANPKKVTINRKGKVTIVDYKKVSQEGDPIQLQPGDIITVAERLF